MGLFSALDIILDMPMERALSVVQVPDPIRHALLRKSGELYPVLELILWYETADWINASRSLILNKLESSDVFGAYLESLMWYNTLIAPVNEPKEA
jgi:EAL and modified HD-GYP domain-containing signal transduction protein